MNLPILSNERYNTMEVEELERDNAEQLVMMPYHQEDIPLHTHRFFELVYVTGGSTLHTLNGKTSRIQEGDYFIVDYGSMHSYQDSQDFMLINCLFLPEIVDDTLRGCQSFEKLMQGCLIRYYSPTTGALTADRIYNDGDGRIRQLLNGMIEEYQQKRAGYREIFRCRLLEILILTLRRVLPSGEEGIKSSLIRKVLSYVDENYQGSVSLGQFCKENHFSLPYTSRKFHEETGMTFRAYLQKMRIEKSCELLRKSDLPVSEIAETVGYSDMKFFNSIFKKALHMTPGEYRKLAAPRRL